MAMAGGCRLPTECGSGAPKGMLPLPVPVEGGAVELRHFLNLKSTTTTSVLLGAWMVAALRLAGTLSEF